MIILTLLVIDVGSGQSGLVLVLVLVLDQLSK
jgi:hypothetical protein